MHSFWPHTDRRAAVLRSPGFWLVAGTLGALAAAGGWTAWKLRASAELVRASEPLQAAPPSPAASLLIVGDSTAVGTGASAPSHSVAGLLAQRHPGLRIVNRAQDGARYEDFIRQLQQNGEVFDTVLVLGGGNDVLRATPEATLRSQVRRALGLAHQRGAQVVVMPPGNVGNAPAWPRPVGWWMDHRSRRLHAAARDAARATGAHYVGLYRPRAEDPFAQRPRELHARDGLHPSDAGYRLWMDELERQAGGVIPRSDRPAPA